MKNAYKIFVGKHEGKRPLGKCRNRWEDNIKMSLFQGADCKSVKTFIYLRERKTMDKYVAVIVTKTTF